MKNTLFVVLAIVVTAIAAGITSVEVSNRYFGPYADWGSNSDWYNASDTAIQVKPLSPEEFEGFMAWVYTTHGQEALNTAAQDGVMPDFLNEYWLNTPDLARGLSQIRPFDNPASREKELSNLNKALSSLSWSDDIFPLFDSGGPVLTSFFQPLMPEGS